MSSAPALQVTSASDETLNQALDRAAGFPGVGIRLLDRHEHETFLPWSFLRKEALATGARLQALGIEAGERVALIYPTGRDFFSAFFGTLAAGAVPVPLYPPVRLGRLDEYHRRTSGLISASGARLVLTDSRIRRILGETIEKAAPALGCRLISGLPGAPPLISPAEVAASALALVQFSSGTTVEPKPVALAHRAIMAQVTSLNRFWPDDDEVRHSGVSWLPLYHDMGLIGCVLAALERPATLTLLPPEAFISRPALWLRAISRYRATVSPAPNFAYSLCVAKVRDEELRGVDLSCWRIALNGAEAVAPEVLRTFSERFGRWGFRAEALTPVYGMSEATLAVTFSNLDRPFTTGRFDRASLAAERVAQDSDDGLELPALGRPLPGFAIEIRDRESGEVLPARHVGAIWVRGPSLMEGYLDRPEASEKVLVDGWLHTGDLGFLVDGELYLTGRAKDVVVLRGRNHPPEEIEQALDGIPGLRAGCAVATSWLPEGEDAERLLLFVETSKDTTREEIAALPEHCREAVLSATGLLPDRVLVVEPGTLPRTSSGKLRRQATLERHLSEQLEPPHPVSTLRMMGAIARSQLAYLRARRDRPPGD